MTMDWGWGWALCSIECSSKSLRLPNGHMTFTQRRINLDAIAIAKKYKLYIHALTYTRRLTQLHFNARDIFVERKLNKYTYMYLPFV